MNREEEISKIAYHMWDLEGRPEGQAMEYWLMAESIWEINNQLSVKDANNKTDPQPDSSQKKE
jgi:hypothetical protein